MKGICHDDRGQATLEYVLIGAVLLIAVVVLGLMWRLVAEGALPNLLQQGSSHVVEQVGGMADALLY